MAAPRILIVEDDSANRRALRGIFRRLGWGVSEAATAGEARAMLDAEPEPDCIILDLMLPDGRGEAVLRYVRSRHWKTRVVVLTGVISVVRLQNLEPLKPDEVLFKPLGIGPVWDTIRKIEGWADDSAAPADKHDG